MRFPIRHIFSLKEKQNSVNKYFPFGKINTVYEVSS